MEYRHELKYLCDDAQLLILRARLAHLLRRDEHQTRAEGYVIRSLYFDDFDDAYLEANYRGFDDRVKFRIRAYERTDDVIRLETKFKLRGMTRKDSCALSRDQYDEIVAGRAPRFSKEMPQPLRYLYTEMSTSLLKPTILVEYTRTAFVEPIGNVRVTFDRNIASSTKVDAMFGETLPLIPLLPPRQHILEVKYDELIPDYLVQTLDLGNLTQITFSKYAMCRSPF